MVQRDARASREEQDFRRADRRRRGEQRGRDGDGELRPARQRRPGEADHGHHEYAQHDGTEPVERVAHDGQRAIGRVEQRQPQHDGKCRQDEAGAGEQPSAPAGAVVPDEDGKLRCGRAGQHVHEREPFQIALLRHPAAPLLDLRLHDAHDRGAAVAHGADLREDAQDFEQPLA
jgi:hypothetical protein